MTSAELQALLLAIPINPEFIDLDGVITALIDHRERPDISPIDKLVANVTISHLYWSRGEYFLAIDAFRRAVGGSDCVVPVEAQRDLKVQLGQLYLQASMLLERDSGADYQKRGLALLTDVLRHNQYVSPAPYILVAKTYLAMDPPDNAEALDWFGRAIDRARDRGIPLEPGWTREYIRLLILTERYEEAVTALEQLVGVHDEEYDWIQLAYLYAELGKANEKLAQMAPLLKAGVLRKKHEYVLLFQLYMLTDNPDAAKQVLEQGYSAGALSDSLRTRFYKQYAAYATVSEADASDRGNYPVMRVQQEFPLKAQMMGISGCVIYGFTISEHGRPTAIRVIDSSDPIFDRFGVEAIEQYRYTPAHQNGVAIPTPDQTIRLVWDLEGEQLPDHPACR